MSDLEIRALTPDRWDDFAALCSKMGPNRSCWCMWWRDQPREKHLATRRERARILVEEGTPPGLISYCDGEPVGWVAAAPRDQYPRLNTGRDTRPIDDLPGVWAVPCFFVVKGHRGEGAAAALLDAAVSFAVARGAEVVHGVPVDPATKSRPDSAAYTGAVSMFSRAGFREAARRTPKGRVLMQWEPPSAK
jgi:GNAT superfamily N-acetyltransferase